MKLNKEKIIDYLQVRPTGVKGWYSGRCPFCGSDKFGIIMNDIGISSYNCFKASCNKGTVFSLLKKLNKLDLLEYNEFLIDSKIVNKISISEEKTLDYELLNKKKPMGFKYIEYDSYLDLRGFTEYQYKLFHTGIALIEPELKNNYIIFLQYQDGECKGYLARSKRTKDWHKQNELRFKIGEERLVLRYKNSINTDFEKMLGGCDELIEGVTETVIIVEGLMDKANTDRQLDLYLTSKIKCCYTYGNKITDYQIKRLQDKKIQNIILLYDYNTIQQTKRYSIELSRYFNCRIGEITLKDRDPGDMTFEEFQVVLSNLKDPYSYNINRVQIKQLK